jgi:gas vesicle protein
MEDKYDRIEINDSNENDASKMNGFLIGAFIGGVIGAAAALFLTPKSGRDFRDNINDQAALLKGKTNQLRETAINKGSEIANLAKEKGNVMAQAITPQSMGPKSEAKTRNNIPEGETQYISIKPNVHKTTKVAIHEDDQDVRKKLEEAKRALDEAESKVKH